MKRFHVHVAVHDLDQSISFYSTLFGAAPSKREGDYAKWMLDDPRVNFAISSRGAAAGVNHLGIQAEDGAELEELHQRLAGANLATRDEENVSCCYARSDKHWATDPQGIAWETFHTLGSVPVYGESQAKAACCDEPAKAACCNEPQARAACCS